MKTMNHKIEVEVREVKDVNIINVELTNDEAKEIIDAIHSVNKFVYQLKSENVRTADVDSALYTLVSLRETLVPCHKCEEY